MGLGTVRVFVASGSPVSFYLQKRQRPRPNERAGWVSQCYLNTDSVRNYRSGTPPPLGMSKGMTDREKELVVPVGAVALIVVGAWILWRRNR